MLKRSDLNLTKKYLKCVDIETSLRIAKAMAVYSILESKNKTQLEKLEREASLERKFSFADVSGTIINNL